MQTLQEKSGMIVLDKQAEALLAAPRRSARRSPTARSS